MKPSTIREIIARIGSELGQLYNDPAEGKSVAELLLCDLMQTSRAGLYGIGGKISDPEVLKKIQLNFDRLLENEPLQYVIGKAWFCGLELAVEPGVLIPRPETEELVNWVVSVNRMDQFNLQILDIGTGSGCIALALKNLLPEAVVTGVDISERALRIARKNSEQLNLDVQWVCQDIFSDNMQFDTDRKLVIVSNPPYVLESERKDMPERVVSYEPSSALFVPDDDPLTFYNKITSVFTQKAAQIFFEINPVVVAEFAQLAEKQGFIFEKRSDFMGKDRMVAFFSRK
ncbi:Release factor glutamine methyltransferase [bioreactor metagenome]|uniref:peptide chain release factor N(5)-glutamine methyltransferase n=1 Tax=bioreactor metagenome TaxID=1076179 RepID=A0A644XAG2_9ZZZZ